MKNVHRRNEKVKQEENKMQVFIPNHSKKIIHTVLLELDVWNLEGKITPITVHNSEDHHQIRRIILSVLNKHVTDPFHTQKVTPNKSHTKTKQKTRAEEEAQINLTAE